MTDSKFIKIFEVFSDSLPVDLSDIEWSIFVPPVITFLKHHVRALRLSQILQKNVFINAVEMA